MRTGADYLAALEDGRQVILGGVPVEDVASHEAFAGVAATIASLYDFAGDEANEMTYVAPETGREALTPFMIPRTPEDLLTRRAAIERWSRVSRGFLGRSPDHVANFLAGFASRPEVFARGERDFSANVERWYRRVLDESLFLSYVIIPPQVSRATTATGWEGEFVQVGVADETSDGIVLRGAQMLGTGAAVADYVLVSCIKPLTPDDVDHAFTAVVPVSAPGLKLYCRRPYAVDQPSSFDYPLSTRYDESDALVVFDDVTVPWEDVFVLKDVAGVRAQFFETPAHILGNSQAQIRLAVKLQFLAGLAHRICEVNGVAKIPSVMEKLAEIATLASLVEGMSVAADAQAVTTDYGVAHANPRFLYGAMGLQAELYPRVLHIIRELAGGGVIQMPSSYLDLVNPETRADMERYVQSPGVPTDERIKLFRLAWDAIGSEFASRHHQYEMFYAGAPFVAKGYAYRNYGFPAVVADVQEFLDGYAVPAPAAQGEQ